MMVIYFDTETTGIDPEKDKVIELAFEVYEKGNKIYEYDKLLNIGEEIPKKITNITGITTKMIKEKGTSPTNALNNIIRYLNDKPLMVAHNCQFDLNFLYRLLISDYSEEYVLKVLSECKWLDTLTIFKDRKSYPHKLKDMVEYYDVDNSNFHRAGDDAGVLHECLLAMRSERNDLREYVNVFGYHPKHGVTGEAFDFITYKAQEYHNGLCGEEDILPYCEPLKRY